MSIESHEDNLRSLYFQVKDAANSVTKNKKHFMENVLKMKSVVANSKQHGFCDNSVSTIVVDSSLIKAAFDYYENPTELSALCTSIPTWENHYTIIRNSDTTTDASSSSDLEKTISRFPIGNSSNLENFLEPYNDEYSNHALPDLNPTLSEGNCESLLQSPNVQGIEPLLFDLGIGLIEECRTTISAEFQNEDVPFTVLTLSPRTASKNTQGVKRRKKRFFTGKKRRRLKKNVGKTVTELELETNTHEIESSSNCVKVCDAKIDNLLEDTSEVLSVKNTEATYELLSDEENLTTAENISGLNVNPSETDEVQTLSLTQSNHKVPETSNNHAKYNTVLENKLCASEDSFNIPLNQISQLSQPEVDINESSIQEHYDGPSNQTVTFDQAQENEFSNSNQMVNNLDCLDEQPQTKVKLNNSTSKFAQQISPTTLCFTSQNSCSLPPYDDELDYEPDEFVESVEVTHNGHPLEADDLKDCDNRTNDEGTFSNIGSEEFVEVNDTMESASDGDEATEQVNSDTSPSKRSNNLPSPESEDRVNGNCQTNYFETNHCVLRDSFRPDISPKESCQNPLAESEIVNNTHSRFNNHLEDGRKPCNLNGSYENANDSYNNSPTGSSFKSFTSPKECPNKSPYEVNPNGVAEEVFSYSGNAHGEYEVMNGGMSSVSTKLSEETKVSSDEESLSDSDQSFKRQMDSSPSYPKPTANGIQDEGSSSSSTKCTPNASSNLHNSIQEVLQNIRNLCSSSEIEEALNFAAEYMNVSSNKKTQIKIYRELFKGILNYIKCPDDSMAERPEMFVEEALKIFYKYKLHDKSLCSYIISKCFLVTCTVHFAVGTFSFCQKEKIHLSKKAISEYSSYAASKDFSTHVLLDFLKYVKEVCKLSVPTLILNKVIVQSLKGQESYLLPEFSQACDLLCQVRTSEVDLGNVKTFIEYCIKNDCWQEVAKFFHSWTQRSKLVRLLCQALACDMKDIGLYYRKFAVAVCDTDGKIPGDFSNLFGQMGVTLMLEAFYEDKLKCAFEILCTLHSYKINYIQLQEPLYRVPSATNTYLSSLVDASEILILPFSLVFIGMEICLRLKRPKDAYQIFKDNPNVLPQCIPDDLKNKAKLQYLKHLLSLIQLLHPVDPLEKGLDVFLTFLSVSADDLMQLNNNCEDINTIFNEYLITYMNGWKVPIALKLYQYSIGVHKNVLNLRREVLRGLIVTFAQHKQVDEASNLFLLGKVMDVYRFEKPSIETFPWHLSILSSWTFWEIRFVLERYIETLIPMLGFKNEGTEFEKWFGIKIVFKESANISLEINCLDEPTGIREVARRTQQALKSIDGSLTWVEHLDDKCLVVNHDSFYNYWKKKYTSVFPMLFGLTGSTSFSFGQKGSQSPGKTVNAFKAVCHNNSGNKASPSGHKDSPIKISPRINNLTEPDNMAKRHLLFGATNSTEQKSPQERIANYSNAIKPNQRPQDDCFYGNDGGWNKFTHQINSPSKQFIKCSPSQSNDDSWTNLSSFTCKMKSPPKPMIKFSPLQNGSLNLPENISFLERHLPLRSGVQQLTRCVSQEAKIPSGTASNRADANEIFSRGLRQSSTLSNHSPEQSVFTEPPKSRMKIKRQRINHLSNCARVATPCTPKIPKPHYYRIPTPAKHCRVLRRPTTPIVKNALQPVPKKLIRLKATPKNSPRKSKKCAKKHSAVTQSRTSFNKDDLKNFTVSFHSHSSERKVIGAIDNVNPVKPTPKKIQSNRKADTQISPPNAKFVNNQEAESSSVFSEDVKMPQPSPQSSCTSISSHSNTTGTSPQQAQKTGRHNVPKDVFQRIKLFLKTKVLFKCKGISPQELDSKVLNFSTIFIQSHMVDSLDRKTMKLLNEFANSFIKS